MRKNCIQVLLVAFLIIALSPLQSFAWHDETHIAIAKGTGYSKWFNACGSEMIKIKALQIERWNHSVNKPPGTVITPQMVLDQASRYNQVDENGHLYGAELSLLL